MQITLWTLNESYQALVKLAQAEFPKEQHKLAYKLSRVLKSAKVEIEAATESLNDLMIKCGITPGQTEGASPEKLADYSERLADYQAQFKDFMHSTHCDIWGDPIRFDEIAGVVAINPFDLALLDWLIVEDGAPKEQPQAAIAATT